MPVWQQLYHSRLYRACAVVPGCFFDEERWFGDRGTGSDLLLVDTVQFGHSATQKFLTLNLFQPGNRPGYFYYIPLLAAERPVPFREHLFARDGFYFYEGVSIPEYIHLIEEQVPGEASYSTSRGRFQFEAYHGFGEPGFTVYGHSSNSLLFISRRYLLKNYRRIHPGVNPELKIGLALAKRNAAEVPNVFGALRYQDETEYTLAVIQEYVENQGTGWELWGILLKEESPGVEERLVRQAYRLGGAIAGLHHHLACFSRSEGKYDQLDGHDLAERLERLIESLRREEAGLLRERTATALAKLEGLGSMLQGNDLGDRFRVHGDLHLEQVLKIEPGWKIIDFEGEPLKSIAERENYDSPLKDLASMLRSVSYRVHTLGTNAGLIMREGLIASGLVRGYLDSYRESLSTYLPSEEKLHQLLVFFQLERAVYECQYELQYRPDWLPIPLNGLSRLLEQI
jgi:maltokinase